MHKYFEWDENKNKINLRKHGVDFKEAMQAFKDKRRVIHDDLSHSKIERRYYCFGKVERGILTVRYTFRNNKFRIIGAGFWNKGKKIYENEN